MRESRVPSVTKSTGAETATTPLVWRASVCAVSFAAWRASVESSAPWVPARAPATAMISDGVPRITVGRSSTSWCASAVRTGNGPMVNASRTHAVPAEAAAWAASTMAVRCSACGVARLITTAEATPAKGPASSGTSTMAGVAPSAYRTFAVKLVTTVLVRHWTRGVRVLTCARACGTNAVSSAGVVYTWSLPGGGGEPAAQAGRPIGERWIRLARAQPERPVAARTSGTITDKSLRVGDAGQVSAGSADLLGEAVGD